MAKVSLGMLDWDADFEETMENHTGFLIDTSIDYKEYLNAKDLEKIKDIFSLDGIYSYKFGMSNQINNNDDILKKSYTCRCHATYGLENLDKVCDKCNTYVRKSIPYRHGWIDLGSHKILHPNLCWVLMTTYREVLLADNKSDITVSDDNITTDELNSDDDDMIITPVSKKNVGHRDEKNRYSLFQLLSKRKLKYNWEDILYKGKLRAFLETYFPNKYKEFDTLLKGKFFVSKIPVLSSEYRPIKITACLSMPDITQNPYNVRYMDITECAKQLLNKSNVFVTAIKINYLVDIMKNVGQIVMDLKHTVGGNKKAHLRGEIYSRRYYNSGRLVLEPIIEKGSFRLDEVHIPLDFFRGIYNDAILKIIDDHYPLISPKQRSRLIDVDQVLTLPERDFIRNDIFPKIEDPYISIHREPCIYITSVLGMRVTKLTDEEMVLRVPFVVLPAIAGDFDGDVLAIISWMDVNDRRRAYQVLNPMKSIVDTMHIKYNSNVGQSNNPAVLLYKGFARDAVVERV